VVGHEDKASVFLYSIFTENIKIYSQNLLPKAQSPLANRDDGLRPFYQITEEKNRNKKK
jgi:hypothetical protein